jgi:hypothetical protein
MSGIENPTNEGGKERWPGEEKDIEKEKEELRLEIESLREAADDLEKRFEEIARGRAEVNYGKRLRGSE